MLDVFAKFAMNVDGEVNGVWKEFHGAHFLIARSGNKNYGKALMHAYAQHEDALAKKDEASEKLADEIMAEVFATTLILDWKDVSYKGKALPYSTKNVKMLLSDPKLHEFRSQLLSLADDVENFRLKVEEEQTKNS